MIVTMSELRATVQKALIGAKAPAGIQEDGGEAALWLEARAIPAIGWVLEALENGTDTRGRADLPNPLRGSNEVTFDFDGQSALFLGPMLFDFLASEEHRTGKPVHFILKRLTHGAFLLPLLEERGGQGERISLTTPKEDLLAIAGPEGLSLSGDWTQCTGTKGFRLETGPIDNLPPAEIARGALQTQYRRHLREGIEVDDGLWRRLRDYAWRSYVPDSEESRLKGAGAHGEPDR